MTHNRAFIALISAALFTGCASSPDAREMNYMGSALTKVSAAVDVTARYKRSADKLDDEELLKASTAHDAELLKPFSQRRVRVQRVGLDSAVLVCDERSGAPLLEDAGCTAKLDAHRWRDESQKSCEFSLDLKQVCSR